jgi:hypothetical protein
LTVDDDILHGVLEILVALKIIQRNKENGVSGTYEINPDGPWAEE